MKGIQKMKRTVMFFALLLACVWMCETKVHAESDYTKNITKKNADFTLSAEYGLGGLVYYDMPAMVSVTVECKENFTGTLRVIPGADYSASKVAYGEDISLAAGEAKTFQFVPTSLGNSGTIVIELVNEKGKVVYGESHVILMESGGSKVTMGILSDDYSALSYFDGIATDVNGDQGVTTIFELTKDNFPEDSKALSMLQYMIIDNFDTASLSQEQYAALKNWVQDGGVLILGLGSHYQNVLNCFQDTFITGTIGALGKKNVSWDMLEEVTGVTALDDNTQKTTEESNTEEQTLEATSMNLDCIEFQLESGEAFSEYTTEGSAYIREMGLGRVVVLSYSMGMEPMTSSSAKQSIAKFIVENSWSSATAGKFYGSDAERNFIYNGLEVAKLADTSQKPSVILYGLILLIYIILVGPILYVILKKRNKREKIWVAIPLVTLVFTAIIYATGFMYRINKPLVSTFTLVQLQEGAKSEKIYTDIICPKPKQYTIQFGEGYTGFRKNVDDYSYSLFDTSTDETSFDYMLKKNSKGTEILLDNTEPFQETAFVVNKNGENNIGTLDSDLTCSTTGFEGTVTNNTCYDLQDVVVTFENYICLVGDVKKGETLTIKPSTIITSNPYGSFDKLYPEKTLYLDKDMYLRYQMNNMIETNLIDKNAYQKGYIWACVPSYQPDLVDGSDVKRAGCGVLFTSYSAEYADIKGVYYPSIDDMAIASQGDYDENDRGIYSSEVVITYSFEEFPGVTQLENLEGQGVSSLSYSNPADVYAYNVETGDYEQIFKDNKVLKGEELQKYMLDDVIVLKYMQTSAGYGAHLPRICARGNE